MNINPFENVIVSEPRRIDRPVSGLNESPLEELINQFQKLIDPSFPRAIKLPGAPFVQSPAPGYGKSHLIGRLFKILRNRATLVYLRPFTSASTCWQSILRKMVQEMEFPDSADAESCGEKEPNQLEALVHGILINVVINGLDSGAIPFKDKEAADKFFKSVTLRQLRSNEKWIKWVTQKKMDLARWMEAQLKRIGVYLNSAPLSWLSVLIKYAYFADEYDLRQTCLDWVRGGSVDDDEASQIGIRSADRLNHDLSIDQVNAACKERIRDFCGLAGFYRPFIFCFDQTENYGSDPLMAKTLGIVIEELVDDCSNHMTVVTANQHPWARNIKPYWEEAHVDRLRKPFLDLKGLNKEQSQELIKIRLEGWDPNAKEMAPILDRGWLNDLFSEGSELGVRHFLRECSGRWRQAGVEKKIEIEEGAQAKDIKEFFQVYVNKIKAQPKRLVYDPDALYWLVQEVADGESVAAGKFKSEKGYLTALWQRENRKIYFGFEAGHHFKRWHAIQREAQRYYESEKTTKVVFFRTPELKLIPGSRWQIAPEIATAKGRYLHIMILNRDNMAELYAAYDVYMDAVEGDIAIKPEKVLAFIRERLKGFWEQMLEPSPERWGCDARPEPEPQPRETELKESLIRKIRDIVKREKFLSVNDLMTKLSPPVSEEELHKARACIAEIQVHISPNMTVLQWRPNR